ncbi:hypothetical protein Taro_028213 [Colocasia esculenta]|uniref:Aminotransferase-like plant mobile domain-containing protein n=1 Tax=Colocasia esculenta TaxID=4460 RepID=A0A843VHX1_COLES|nr:hypothetical protein [Colocasia esculenta]
MPTDARFAAGSHDIRCLLDHIVDYTSASWYGHWSVIPSHIFRYGATEWLAGVLHHYGDMLKASGIYGAVETALYDYPCYTGILRALVERFNTRWNTFGTAEGETSVDLWSLHQISGLPISGQPYEEVVLNDLHSHRSNGSGRYVHPYSLRFLTKFFSRRPSSRRLSATGSEKAFSGTIYLFPKDMGWNPRRLPDRTHLAAYLPRLPAAPALKANRNRGNEIRPDVLSSSNNRRVEKAKEVTCASSSGDEADGVSTTPSPADECNSLLESPSVFHGEGNGSTLQAMTDPLPEEGTDGNPSHFAFSGMAETDADYPGFTYAELGASVEEYSSASVEVYIPRAVEEPPVGAASFGASFSIPSWGISMSPLLDFPAQSAFQVKMTWARWIEALESDTDVGDLEAAEVRKRRKTRELRMAAREKSIARLERELDEARSSQDQDARNEVEDSEEGGLYVKDGNDSRRSRSSKAKKAERLQRKTPSCLCFSA